MSRRKILIGACIGSALLATGAAGAADTTSHGPRNFDPAWHKQMCTDRYAHNAGRIAFIEAKLSLTESQHPLFDNWKQTVLRSAKARENECLARQTRGGEHNILERQARVMQRLQHRVADMTAERPSFEALYNALSPEQRKAFERQDGSRGPHGHGGGFDHGHHNGPDDRA